MICYVIIQL